MRYRPLGQSGLFVSELCLGAMTFGGDGGIWESMGKLGQSDAEALIKAAFDAGVNFFDTANAYGHGDSERILGQAIKTLGIARDQAVIATKVLAPVGPGPNQCGASRGHILDQAKASLARLGMDHIDLYQIHGFDPGTPIVETLEALDTLVRQGLVRYIGLSNWAAWQVARAVGITEARRLAPILSLQAYYTLIGRDLEREIVPMLQAEKIGLMVWSPLAGGYLSGKYEADGQAADGRRATFDFPPVDKVRGKALLATMREMASAKGCSMAQIALAWLLHQDVVTSVIIGAKHMDQLSDNLAAVDVRLDASELSALDEISKLAPEYPGWILASQAGYRQLG